MEVDRAEPPVEMKKKMEKQHVKREEPEEVDESRSKKKKRRIEDGAEVVQVAQIKSTLPSTDECETTHKLNKKQKKKKLRDNNNGFDKSTDAGEVRTAENSNEKASNGKKNRKHKNKLPQISEDRLRAYGINVKKFKYCHSKKLLKEQSR